MSTPTKRKHTVASPKAIDDSIVKHAKNDADPRSVSQKKDTMATIGDHEEFTASFVAAASHSGDAAPQDVFTESIADAIHAIPRAFRSHVLLQMIGEITRQDSVHTMATKIDSICKYISAQSHLKDLGLNTSYRGTRGSILLFEMVRLFQPLAASPLDSVTESAKRYDTWAQFKACFIDNQSRLFSTFDPSITMDRDEGKLTIVHYMIRWLDLEPNTAYTYLIPHLFALGVDPQAQTNTGASYLHDCTKFTFNSRGKAFAFLHDLGVDFNLQSNNGNTFVHELVHLQRVDALIELGQIKNVHHIDFLAHNRAGETPMDLARTLYAQKADVTRTKVLEAIELATTTWKEKVWPLYRVAVLTYTPLIPDLASMVMDYI